jgi:FtsZ-binding cell division protein ZapB
LKDLFFKQIASLQLWLDDLKECDSVLEDVGEADRPQTDLINNNNNNFNADNNDLQQPNIDTRQQLLRDLINRMSTVTSKQIPNSCRTVNSREYGEK